MKKEPLKNIILAGFMGTGKTEVGHIVAEKLHCSFVDLDAEIEKEQGMSIAELFRVHGEAHFREIEAVMIARVAASACSVIATGGGAVLRQENVEHLKRGGVIVCLTATPETILQRTMHDTSRPLLQGEEPLKKIKELLETRRPFYEKADIMINTEGKTPEGVAEEIIKRVR